ncbi:MAG: hypothetical protein IKO26_05945 [Paludibacteraceae bacterium]|nr:hypothetical protein [Paludibacteraceae bacterium]
MASTIENRELRTAWEFVENTGRSIFLTGKAGTGKTTFLKTVVGIVELRSRQPRKKRGSLLRMNLSEMAATCAFGNVVARTIPLR